MPRSSAEKRCYPVIDLFAGPGGLGEGFAALEHTHVAFDVVLSVEKDPAAHRTLLLRSFFRQLCDINARQAYYRYLKGELSQQKLFELCPQAAQEAEARCLNLTLGPHSTKRMYAHIDGHIGESRSWVLVGGPPCQAYSVVGRSRLAKERREGGDKFEKRDKHVLYREYLRILARYGPPLFVMENVKGLLSAEYGGQSTFERIISDLSSPAAALRESLREHAPRNRRGGDYAIYSFVHPGQGVLKPEEYVIPAEKFGVPQKRHRVILLGVRTDLQVPNGLSIRPSEAPTVRQVLADLPPLRSRLSREPDTPETWAAAIRQLVKELSGKDVPEEVRERMRASIQCLRSDAGWGGRWVPKQADTALPGSHLSAWLADDAMDFVVNHETRRHIRRDLLRYLFAASYAAVKGRSPKLHEFPRALWPEHENVAHTVQHRHGFFNDRFRVQVEERSATTVTSHICKDGHYFIHHDPLQCRSWTVREAARVQTFPDNYFFEGTRTDQYRQVGNAVPPYLALQIAELVAAILSSQAA